MISKEHKSQIMKKFAKSANDSGSSAVQVALLSERIQQISQHLSAFPKDESSKLGLIKLVGRRKQLLSYLKRTDKTGYENIVKRLKETNF